MPIHPKTSGAAVGGAIGVLIVSILHSISGVHLTAEVAGAIPSFLSLLGAWLVPSATATIAYPAQVSVGTLNQRTTVTKPEPPRPTGPTAPVP